MSLINLVKIQLLGDERGQLISLESQKNVPFEIKRTYCIFANENNSSRGFHAHKKLEQLLVCVTGSCKIILDNGVVRESIVLDCASKGLLINNHTWREMHDFSKDCVLLVLASEHYDENDYIRNYQEFLEGASK